MSIEERLERIERTIVLASKEILNVAECALLLGKSESRIRHMISERMIPYYKVGGRTVFSKSELEKHMLQSDNRVPTMAEIESQAATYIATRNRR